MQFLPKWVRADEIPVQKARASLPPKIGCDHRNAFVTGAEHMGFAHCPECHCEVPLAAVFNTLLNLMRAAINKGPQGAINGRNGGSSHHATLTAARNRIPDNAMAGPKGKLPG